MTAEVRELFAYTSGLFGEEIGASSDDGCLEDGISSIVAMAVEQYIADYCSPGDTVFSPGIIKEVEDFIIEEMKD